MRLAEAEYLDEVARLVGMSRVEQLTDPYSLLADSLQDGYEKCDALDRVDSRNRWVTEYLGTADPLGLKARLLAATVQHLCPQHRDLLG